MQARGIREADFYLDVPFQVDDFQLVDSLAVYALHHSLVSECRLQCEEPIAPHRSELLLLVMCDPADFGSRIDDA